MINLNAEPRLHVMIPCKRDLGLIDSREHVTKARVVFNYQDRKLSTRSSADLRPRSIDFLQRKTPHNGKIARYANELLHTEAARARASF